MPPENPPLDDLPVNADPPIGRRVLRRAMLAIAIVGGLAALAVGADWFIAVPIDREPQYVGRETCAQCHAEQVHDFAGSHHDLAMDLATEETVLADFNDAEYTYEGLTSKMFRRDGSFYIHTEGADGKLDDFKIKYVIGVEPLQQYMVEFDDGRVQVLRETWDTERKRWFYHYPPDVRDERLKPDDPLHWIGQQSNWNFMCADCHTTNLKKNFDVASDKYHTTFSEMDASCETCHGPGSIHVALANSRSILWDRNHGYGLAKLKGPTSKNQIESCAKCHMRRARVLTDEFRPGGELCDHFGVSGLHQPLYHADGQINDEVYVYGSFLQSKMHAQGIRCTDCHDPHTAKLKHEGNRLCTSCHQHPAQKYDTPAHHHHTQGSEGARCVECHMPEKHYMVVDARRDHSLRVPRPDLSVDLRTPNACSGCHLQMELDKEGGGDANVHEVRQPYYEDWLAAAQQGPGPERDRLEKLDRWALERTTKWYDKRKERHPHFAYALAAARENKPNAEQSLVELVRRPLEPPIVRATAIVELGLRGDRSARTIAAESLKDKSPLVRAAALNILLDAPLRASADRDSTPLDQVAPLLSDPVRLVRIDAARVLAPYIQFMTEDERTRFNLAATELKVSNATYADRSEAHREQALFHERIGQHAEADAAIENALRLSQTGPEASDLHYRKAMILVGRDDLAGAEQELQKALDRDNASRMAMRALVALYIDQQRFDAALAMMKRWYEQFPDDPEVVELLRHIQFSRRRAQSQQPPQDVPVPLRPPAQP